METKRRADPFGVAALVAAGTMTGHELGYLAETRESVVSHDYFGVVGPVVVLALCVAAWGAAVDVLRRDTGRTPRLAAIAGFQTALYLAIEVGERLSTGSTGSLLSVPVLLGLVLQPVVAWVALRLLAVGRRLIEAVFGRPAPRHRSVDRPLHPWHLDVHVERDISHGLCVRGPPMS